MALTLARASWDASLIFTSNLNSTTTVETLSREAEVTCLTPEIGLTASSIRFVTSLSTVSGEAPGYFVTMERMGISTSGNMSTARRRYEKMPSVRRASIITVAKMGLLIERSDRNIALTSAALLEAHP